MSHPLHAWRVCATGAQQRPCTTARPWHRPWQVAAERVNELTQALDRHEPVNAPLYLSVARPLSRLAGRNPGLLSLTLALADKAASLAPHKAEYAAEHAYQFMLLDDHQEAMSTLKRASGMAEGADEVMPYLIRAQILSGDLMDAEMQLEFVKDLGTASPENSLNMAYVAMRRHGNAAEAVAHLDSALEAHMATLRGVPFGVDYFTKLNPDFLLEVGKEYLKHCQEEPSAAEDASGTSMLLSKAMKLFQIVTKQVSPPLPSRRLPCHPIASPPLRSASTKAARPSHIARPQLRAPTPPHPARPHAPSRPLAAWALATLAGAGPPRRAAAPRTRVLSEGRLRRRPSLLLSMLQGRPVVCRRCAPPGADPTEGG